MHGKKILLLNPPGDKVYLRDAFCSKVSKGNFINQPLDFVILSGILAQNYNIILLDAIAEKISFDNCLKMIMALAPDVVIFLTGYASWKNDFAFIKRIKVNQQVLVIGLGDIFFDDEIAKFALDEFLDAACFDFTTDDIVKFIEGKISEVNNMAFKLNGSFVRRGQKEPKEIFSIPVPRHEKFPNHRYNFPFIKKHPFVSTLTSFGCPFKCGFCITASLGFKYRKAEEVLDELMYIRSMGIQEAYIADQTFFAIKTEHIKLCEMMLEERLNLSWLCYSRVDIVNEGLLNLAKKAGCHTVIFGVESGDDEILKKYNKGFTIRQVKDIFGLCRKIGIRTVATFIIGLPGQDLQSCLKTIEFSKKIGCDYASFNVPVPRPCTEMHKEAMLNKRMGTKLQTMDQSGSGTPMATDELSSGKICELRNKAEREFYFRFSYILKRLINIKSFYELKMDILQAWELFMHLRPNI